MVLLVERNEEGAFGVVVNRPGENKVGELCAGLNVDWGGDSSALALYGGPVGTQQGFVLHGDVADDVTVNSREVTSGIRIASDMETFRALCRRPPADFRIMLGYAGDSSTSYNENIQAASYDQYLEIYSTAPNYTIPSNVYVIDLRDWTPTHT